MVNLRWPGFLVLILVGAAAAQDPTATTTPPMCSVVNVNTYPYWVGEGDKEICRFVDVDDCCWTASVTGAAKLRSAPYQCGDEFVCVYVNSCDCSACVNSFTVQVGDKTIDGECRNQTPTHTVTRTMTPATSPTATPTGSLPPTATSTATRTPTNTRTITPTATRTATRTWTPLPPATATDTADPDPTATPTATPSDTPTPSPTPIPGLCADVPRGGCRHSLRPGSGLRIQTSADPARRRFEWKWLRGEAVADMADPTAGGRYALCVYDGVAGVPEPVMAIELPAGASWKRTSHGYKYRDRSLAADGMRSLKVIAGSAGRSALALRGQGGNLPLPQLPMQQSAEVIVQLVDDHGGCWESRFSSHVLNDSTGFRAKDAN